jgi:putative membrane protein
LTDQPKKPVMIDWADEADPSLAPAVPDLELPQGRAMQVVGRVAVAHGSPLSRFAFWVFTTLAGFVLSVAAWDFVTNLLSRDSFLGWVAFILVGTALLVALALALREWRAYLRLGRLADVRVQAAEAREKGDLAAAKACIAGLTHLYAGRDDLAWGRARLAEIGGDVFDADALLSLAETELMGPLDQAARREIESAARQVATVTALVPLALADVVTALFANLRMIRRLAEIYGGRSGTMGSWGLLRRVFTYLIATGAVAIGDDLIGSFAGGGVLSKLSRRFGEGVINGALTARVGLAAMELCRPMPFVVLPRPKVTNLVSRGLAGLFGGKANLAQAESDSI